MNSSLIVPLAMSASGYAIPKLLPKIFPIEKDNFLGDSIRCYMRSKVENFLSVNETRRRVFSIAIPDNLWVVSWIVMHYLIQKKEHLDWEVASPVVGMTVALIGALHCFRKISCEVLAPVSGRYLPARLGGLLEFFFKQIGPSELRRM